MLAWIFWHTPMPGVATGEYRAALAAFHSRIAERKPPGFLGVRVLAYAGAPWLPSAREVYEDWYFLESSAALDPLDEAAIAEFARGVHDNVARLAGDATAGLYRLRAGRPLDAPTHCIWTSKPRGERYDTFIRQLQDHGTVWCRQMVLGPAPEFCVESDREDVSGWRDAVVQRPT